MRIILWLFLPFVIFLSSCTRNRNEITLMTFNIRLYLASDGENRWDNNFRVLSYRVDEVIENGIFISDH